MATKHTDRSLQKAADNEPIFVLRAQDKLAPKIVRLWAREFFEALGGVLPNKEAYDKYQEALALADKMDAWETKKLPD